MPDHFHVLLNQSEDGLSVPKCMANFKKITSAKIKLPDFHGVRLWCDGYDDVLVPGVGATWTKLQYMHANPGRENLIELPEHYLWSSAR